MGIDYYQHVIVGIKFNRDSFRREISPAIWEMQKRYDTKTGKVSHVERVLVKDAQYEWFLPNTNIKLDCKDHYDLDSSILKLCKNNFKVDLDVKIFEDNIYIGKEINLTQSYGRFHPLNGYIPSEDFKNNFLQLTLDNLSKMCYNNPENFGLYFVPDVC